MAATAKKLPRPVTTGDLYLAAILAELSEIRLALSGQPDPAPQPQPVAAIVGDFIQPDYPGAQALADAGITSLDQVPTSQAALVKISGIGPATAKAILAHDS